MSTPTRPTITDVASRAGVSIAAVSFAVNGRTGVGDDTRRRILKAAEELGWRPSAPARALTSARAGAVGLVLARALGNLEVDPFFIRFLVGVERALASHDEGLLLQVRDSPREEVDPDAYVRLVAEGRVDGFLLTDVQIADPRFALIERLGVPAVVAGRPGPGCSFPSVETEHAAGMAAVVETLIGLGHQRIGFVGGFDRYEYVMRRREEWERALARADLPAGPATHAVLADPLARAATLRVLDHAPTAVVYTSDLLAIGGLAEARRRGLDVPRDLSIAGFDDSPIASPADLASVQIDYAGLGEASAAALMALVCGRPAPSYAPAPPQLVLRGSIGPPRI
jgi:DNA-binding LacI/PurR family transcriptional regulator